MRLSKTCQTSQFLLPPLESAGLFLLPPAINQNPNGTLSQLQLRETQAHKAKQRGGLHSELQGFQISTGARMTGGARGCMLGCLPLRWNDTLFLLLLEACCLSGRQHPALNVTNNDRNTAKIVAAVASAKHFSRLSEMDPAHNSTLLL